jgi:DNA (cytosine-5)-methyltransferase 1
VGVLVQQVGIGTALCGWGERVQLDQWSERWRPEDVDALRGALRTRRTFIDLFAGCGGLSLGLMNAGWEGLFAVEKDSFAFETLKHNLLDSGHGPSYAWPDWLPKKPYVIGPFAKKYHQELEPLKGNVVLIAGGPPCQGFSLAGRRKRNDPRNQLFRHYVEIVRVIQPPLLLLENVRGITVEFGKKKRANGKGRGRPATPFSQKIKSKLEDLGYAVYMKLIRAADFGVPQLRPRYFMIAVRRDLLEERDNFDPFSGLEDIRKEFLKKKGLPLDRPVSVKEALSDLEVRGQPLVECVDSPGFKQITYTEPETSYQKLLHGDLNGTAPNSLRLANHRPHIVARFRRILNTCRRGVQLNRADRERLGLNKHCTVPLDPDKPSHTLTTLPDDLLHYAEPRILSVREYARLQSFPDWYSFTGKYTTGGHLRVLQCPRYTQVGNAVPPFLAECLGMLANRLASELLLEGRRTSAAETPIAAVREVA